MRAALRAVQRRACSGGRDGGKDAAGALEWTDAESAAHIVSTVLPRTRGLGPKDSAALLADELAKMEKVGCTVWVQTWAAAMERFAPRSRRRSTTESQEAAQKLFGACVASGCEPDAGVYSRLIRAQRSYEDARVVFDFMVLDCTAPDEDCITAVLEKAVRHRRTCGHKVDSLLAFIVHEGIVLTPSIWERVLATYGRSGDYAGAATQLLRMKDAGIVPTADTFAYFVEACAKAKDATEGFQTAELAVSQQVSMGVPMSARGCAKLMAVYARSVSEKRARQLYNAAKKEGKVTAELLFHFSEVYRRSDAPGSAKKARAFRRAARRVSLAALADLAQRSPAWRAVRRRWLKAAAAAAAKKKAQKAKPQPKKKKKKKAADPWAEDDIGRLISQHLEEVEAAKVKSQQVVPQPKKNQEFGVARRQTVVL